jgi:GTP cyclohydrolase I
MDREQAARAIDAFLRALGRDPDGDPALTGTGARVAAAFADDLLAGYSVDVDALVAKNVLPGTSEVVIVRDLPVTTTCPHHLLPSSGFATVAFAPDARLLGVGAVARLVDALARRLALQEEVGEGVVTVLAKHLAPRWAGCRLVLTHACMTARGERAHGSRVETVALRSGDPQLRPNHEQAALLALGVGR